MQIIYGFSNCTDKKYNEIFEDTKAGVIQPGQKYHSLLIKGLSLAGIKVFCLSGLPINRRVTKRLWIHEQDEQEGNASFHYFRNFNIPVLRQIMILFGAFFNILKFKESQATYAMCDCLNIANSYGMLLACKVKKIPLVLIVTDLPDMLSNNKLLTTCNNWLFDMADGFVFLTEQMNARINKKQKPYIVLEGHVDSSLQPVNLKDKFEEILGKKVFLYAGSIHKLYGIQNLVEGFLKANILDAELYIFGNGDYREELIRIANEHDNIKYMGIVNNDEVVKHEQRAMLLINPRPTAPEYTKYSFPSKNMEYMVSGTPILTTKLPGMPSEYYPYIYYIEDETSEGIKRALEEISKKSFSERCHKGQQAREFVLQYKSNVAQAKKIVKFLCEEVEGR